VVHDGRGDNEPIGKVRMEARKLYCEHRDCSCQRQFDKSSIKQLRAKCGWPLTQFKSTLRSEQGNFPKADCAEGQSILIACCKGDRATFLPECWCKPAFSALVQAS
jgi:hypothetical protein